MSDHNISIVPKKSRYPNKNVKAQEIVDWLISKDIVKGTLSDCVLGSDSGFAISDGAKMVTNLPNDLPFDLITNGLEITDERQIFHIGENALESCICPNCKENIAPENWIFFEEWFEHEKDEVYCPNCDFPSDINDYQFTPEWGFSDLGFTFWNWPELTEEFIKDFKARLAVDVSVVYAHI